jgi:mannose-6-phosphate isomerase-like protein (cupin superfamily)
MSDRAQAHERWMTVPPPLTVVDLATEAISIAPGSPNKPLARLNESGVRLAVFQGEADWHAHDGTDECFIVLDGTLTVDLYETGSLTIRAGQLVTIPGGTVHRPRAEQPTVFLCFKRIVGHTQHFEVVTTNEDEAARRANDRRSEDRRSEDRRSEDRRNDERRSGDRRTGDRRAGERRMAERRARHRSVGDRRVGDRRVDDRRSIDRRTADRREVERRDGERRLMSA